MENYKMLVTPEVAASLLEKVPEYQRRASSAFVDMYASDMENGRWNEALGCRIIIGKNGELMDGQHRMMAIVKSGKSYMFDVLEGLDESEFTKIDQGKTRTAGDFASRKFKNYVTLVAVARTKLFISKNLRFSSVYKRAGKASNKELFDFIENNYEELQQLAQKIKKFERLCGKQKASEYTLVYSVCENLFCQKAVEFFDTLSSENAFDDPRCSKAIAKIASSENLADLDFGLILFTACEAFCKDKGISCIKIDAAAKNRLKTSYENMNSKIKF